MSEPTPRDLERAIIELLDERGAGKTICPSDIARALGPAQGWRRLMQPTRDAAGRLVERGKVEITQGGEGWDHATARGPIRIRRT
jgi:hypothetical protein